MKASLTPENLPRPSLADVARHAGVAVATASYALRSHPKIPEATRLRVRASADAIGYRVNAVVGRLMAELRSDRPESGLTTLAWINCQSDREIYHTRPWLRGWLDGARARAAHLGYRLGGNVDGRSGARARAAAAGAADAGGPGHHHRADAHDGRHFQHGCVGVQRGNDGADVSAAAVPSGCGG